jgi:hypothetical protein
MFIVDVYLQKEYTAVIWLSRLVKDSELSDIACMKELVYLLSSRGENYITYISL